MKKLMMAVALSAGFLGLGNVEALGSVGALRVINNSGLTVSVNSTQLANNASMDLQYPNLYCDIVVPKTVAGKRGSPSRLVNARIWIPADGVGFTEIYTLTADAGSAFLTSNYRGLLGQASFQ